jgi:uncharacterized protein YdaU (DUF1376 family)
MHYYPKNIGDYRRDTMNLSLLEHGVYMTLIDHYILNEEPISLDHLDVCWTIGARADNEKTAVCLILSKFFIKTDEGYTHKRCDEEIAQYRLRADTARENGKKGGRRKPNPNPTLTQPLANQEPITKNQEPLTNKDFETFYAKYPKKVKRPNAEKAWLKAKPDIDIVMKALEYQLSNDSRFRDAQYIPHPSTWINGKEWENEVSKKEEVVDRLVIANELYKQDEGFYNLTKEEQNERINSYTK